MRKPTQKFSREAWIGYSMALMMLSLFLSRAALSVSMMLFLVLTIVHGSVGRQVKFFLQNKFLLFFSLLFWMPFVSGLWSENLLQWESVVVMKLPLLFFPLAFAGDWKLSERKWRQLGFLFIAVVTIGCAWSLLQYFFQPESFHEAYLQAKLITTPLENDHVRFSWMVAVAVIVAAFLIPEQKRFSVLLSVVALFLVIYLHVLAARMGLACLYIAVFMGLVVKFRKLSLKLRTGILAAVLLLPLLAWLALPTFQNRLKYFRFDITENWHGHYMPGSNDGARLLSMRAGADMLAAHPFGVGAGDLMANTQHWFDTNEPQVIAADRFPPMNEWLMYGGFAGWPGVLLFSLAVLFPFFVKDIRHRFFWLILNVIIVFSYFFDMALEVQYGVFLYSFILLWWYKWFKPE